MKTVCIIGGGFSGSAAAMRLLDKNANLQVKLINSGHPLVQGIAYSATGEEHLLNVPAGKMSAFPDLPAHFIDWLRTKPEYEYLVTENIVQAFLPRAVYGLYLKELMNNYQNDQRLELISAKATNVTAQEDQYIISLDNNRTINAVALILAIGNYLPAAPKISNTAVFENKYYFRSPWDNSFLKNIRDNETILLIGTGLTMVDCVLSLKKLNFKGKIMAVSPRGYIPAAHTTTAAYPDFYDELKDKDLLGILKTVRKHFKIAAEKKLAWQSVIDSIRPYAQRIWISLDKRQKQQFTSHLRHIWGVARHRVPEHIYGQIMNRENDLQLEIIGGRVRSIEEENDLFKVEIRTRKTQMKQTLVVSRIVNCTGPQINYSEINDELVKNLIANSIIHPDELKMGIAALHNGQVLDKSGKPVKNVFAIGSLLRGVLWETTAVPEIRMQAENVARQISDSTN